MPASMPSTDDTLRRLLLGVFLLGTLGAGIELLLLGHYEELPQLIPLGMITAGLVVSALWLLAGIPRILRVFQAFMLFYVISGGLGIYLHYESNVEFELEMNPAAGGGELIWNSLTGAMPALAPGALLQLGLIGLLYTYRHPVFSVSEKTEASSREENR
jgi:hypothetical protein